MVCLVSRIPIFGLFAGMNVYSTKISPNILVWEFSGKAQFSQSFGRMARNYGSCACPQNSHIRKLGEISVFYSVYAFDFL